MTQPLNVYLPMDRRQALARGEPLPERGVDVALLADIAGFTPLTEALVRAVGPLRGAEEVTALLNGAYGVLIDAVDSFGGSVICFSGDAITCWFGAGADDAAVKSTRPTGAVELRAAACALAMQQTMGAFAAIPIPGGGSAALSVSVALAGGSARRLLVGGPALQRYEVLAGTLLDRLAALQHQARAGEVLIDESLAQRLGPRARISWRDTSEGEAVAAVAALSGDVPLKPWPSLPAALTDDDCRPWLLPAVAARLAHTPAPFLAELRPAVALMLEFHGLDRRALIQPVGGTDGDDGLQYVASSALAQEAQLLPDTLQGLLLARIDRLPPDEQLTLKVAAVVGATFTYPPLRHARARSVPTDDATLRRHLEALTAQELTTPLANGPEPAYRFTHILAQEAAYQTLLYAQRHSLHRSVAEWYERRAAPSAAGDPPPLDDRRSPLLPLLAHHYRHAEDVARERHYARLAGIHAADQYANSEALAFFTRALELTLPEDLAGRFDLMLERLNIHIRQERVVAVAGELDLMEPLADALNDDPQRHRAFNERPLGTRLQYAGQPHRDPGWPRVGSWSRRRASLSTAANGQACTIRMSNHTQDSGALEPLCWPHRDKHHSDNDSPIKHRHLGGHWEAPLRQRVGATSNVVCTTTQQMRRSHDGQRRRTSGGRRGRPQASHLTPEHAQGRRRSARRPGSGQPGRRGGGPCR